MDCVRSSTFGNYIAELRRFNLDALRSGGIALSSVELANAHLDGRASRELRASVALADLRELGAFFTGERLAERAAGLLALPTVQRPLLDPACGCGDLLLAMARRLPVEDDLEATLARWGALLHGRELVAEFVEVTRLRLLLLAVLRGASPSGGRHDLDVLLRHIRVGDGLERRSVQQAGMMIMNPPYGRVPAPEGCGFTSGITTASAVWVSELLSASADGTEIVAVLPDVLRSGSRYGVWREQLARDSEILAVETHGQFDALTDVDVFVTHLRRCTVGSPVGWPALATDVGVEGTLGERCTVAVGPVVDRRDAHRGGWVGYLTARDLPRDGEFTAVRKRRFAKRLFQPPFVVIRRTSRPTTQAVRLRPVVIRGSHPVAVENHLLVLVPHTQTVRECRALAHGLVEASVTAWLNMRIRCRHLTVGAVRELPLPGPAQEAPASGA